jgi:hypothetical protein
VIALHSGVCATALCDSAQSATSAATYFILSPFSAAGIQMGRRFPRRAEIIQSNQKVWPMVRQNAHIRVRCPSGFRLPPPHLDASVVGLISVRVWF